ncbi:MAG: Wzz/FepE/Etk N-terminal domain-containing protein [Pararhodobacter sp.]
MGPIQNLHEIRSWLRRRWHLMALCAMLGTLGGVLMALNSDRVYSAHAVIQVINPVIVATTDDGTGAQIPDVTRRVQMIEQRLMSREALLALAERHNLFDGLPLTASEKVVLMRQSFSITSIAAAQQGFARDGSLSALIVSASAEIPETAAAIANELADQLVSQSVSARQSGAQQALEFFRFEETRLERAIDALEAEIAAYRSTNQGFMSEAISLRRDEQDRLADALRDVRTLINARRGELAGFDTAATSRAVTQRRIAEINEDLVQLNGQAAILSERIAEIQELLTQAPVFEQHLLAMNRRMEQFQAQLTAAADRRREAELSARIEDDQQSERFELLEAALVPEHPVSRSRTQVALMGIVAGLMLGALLAYALEWLHPVMRTAQRMERDLQLRPAISIPFTFSRRERRRRQMIWTLGLLVLMAGLAALTAQWGGLI